jgi:PHP family Zn ribbon phosphoesterase
LKLAVDLHSHSGYAGGVGQIELTEVSRTMKLKGIDVFGSGDCIFPPRTEELKHELYELIKNNCHSFSDDEAEKMIRSAMGAKYYNTVHTNELFFILIDHTFNEMEDNLKLSTYFYNMIKKIAKEETSKYSSKKF